MNNEELAAEIRRRALGLGYEKCGIVDMDTETLDELLGEKFWYISKERHWKWKVNVLNAMKNTYRDEYLPRIEKSCHDPDKQVRSTAAWVLQSIHVRLSHQPDSTINML